MCPSLQVTIEAIIQFIPEWQSTALKDTGFVERCRWESLLWEKLQHELSSSVFYLAHWLANELTTAFANFCLTNIQGMQKIGVLV